VLVRRYDAVHPTARKQRKKDNRDEQNVMSVVDRPTVVPHHTPFAKAMRRKSLPATRSRDNNNYYHHRRHLACGRLSFADWLYSVAPKKMATKKRRCKICCANVANATINAPDHATCEGDMCFLCVAKWSQASMARSGGKHLACPFCRTPFQLRDIVFLSATLRNDG
jgi:hypothetical protein